MKSCPNCGAKGVSSSSLLVPLVGPELKCHNCSAKLRVVGFREGLLAGLPLLIYLFLKLFLPAFSPYLDIAVILALGAVSCILFVRMVRLEVVSRSKI